MGLFDDLIPSLQQQEAPATSGLFDDLIPDAPPSRRMRGQVQGQPNAEAPAPSGGFSSVLDEPVQMGAPERSVRPMARGEYQAPEEEAVASPRMRGQIRASRTREPVETQPASDLGRRAARGFTEVGAAVPEALAIAGLGDENTGGRASAEAYRGFAQREREMVDLGREALQSDSLSEDERASIQRKIQEAERRAAAYEDAAAQSDLPETPTERRELYQIGDRLRSASTELFGAPDPKFDERFLSSLAEGGGNMVGFAATTILTGLAGGAAVGSALNTSATYKDAIEHGATEEEAKAAAYIGAAIGSTEVIPIGRAFNLLPSAARRKAATALGRRMTNVLASAGEEGVQEALAEIANNINAKVLSGYDPERGIDEGVLESAVVGAILGGGMGAIAPAPRAEDTERADSPRLTEDDRRSPIRNDIIDDGKRILEELSAAPPTPEVASTGFDQALAPQQEADPRPSSAQEAPPAPVAAPEALTQPETEEAAQRPASEPQPQAQDRAPEQPAVADEWEELPVFDEQGRETSERIRVNWKTGEMVPVGQDAAPEVDTAPAAPATQPQAQTEAPIQPQPPQEELPRDTTAPVESLEAPDAGVQSQGQGGTGAQRLPIQILSNEELTSVEADPETFQYKSGGDEEGVTERLRGVKRWDTARAGTAIVFEREDGSRVVADGHQRLALAKRMRAEGQDVQMPVILRRESDGYTAEQVMIEAAMKNIAESPSLANADPQLTIDAAKVMRATPEATAEDMNLPPQSALVRHAMNLRNLAPDAFGMVVNDPGMMRNASVVGREVKNPELHTGIISLLNRLKPANEFQAQQIAQQAAAETTTETQASLFGEETVQESLYLERAKVLDGALKRIKMDKSTFKTLVDRGDTIASAGNKLDQDANKQRLQDDAIVQEYLSRQANTKGPISDALTEAARRLRAGESTGQVVGGFVEAVRRANRDGDPKRDGVGQTRASLERQPETQAPEVSAQSVDPLIAHREALDEFNRLDAERKISDPQAYFDASSRLAKARDGLADSIAEQGGRIELATKDGRGAVITPQGDGFQISYFDKRGFSGDTRHKDLRAAVRDAIGQGYEFRADGLLKQNQKGAEWRSPAETQRIMDEVEGRTAPQKQEGNSALSENMRKVLSRAGGEMGAADNVFGKEVHEAQKNGWIEYWRTPQNSTTRRYKLTDAGRKALEGVNADPVGAKSPDLPPTTERTTLEEYAPKSDRRMTHVYAEAKGYRYYVGSYDTQDAAKQAIQIGRAKAPEASFFQTDRADATRIHGDMEAFAATRAQEPNASAEGPTGVDYPNRKLGFRYARSTEPQEGLGNIALSNMKPGEMIRGYGEVAQITDKQIRIKGEDGKTKIFPVDSPRFKALARDVDGIIMGSQHGGDGGDVLTALKRDPAFSYDERQIPRLSDTERGGKEGPNTSILKPLGGKGENAPADPGNSRLAAEDQAGTVSDSAPSPEQAADWWTMASRENDGAEALFVLEKAGVAFSNRGRPWRDIRPADQERILAARAAMRETITPANDTLIGKNDAGEPIYQREDGQVYRMRNDRKDRPGGYPDFGGDLSVVEAEPPATTELPSGIVAKSTGPDTGGLTEAEAYSAITQWLAEGRPETGGGARVNGRLVSLSWDQWWGRNRVAKPEGKVFVSEEGEDAIYFDAKIFREAIENAPATTERTEAGEQMVIPGAEQDAGASRAAEEAAQAKALADTKQRQSKMRTGVAQQEAGPLFDTQGDMFAEPEAKPDSRAKVKLTDILRKEWEAREALPDEATDEFIAATKKVGEARRALADEFGDEAASAAIEKIEADWTEKTGGAAGQAPSTGFSQSDKTGAVSQQNQGVATRRGAERIEDFGEVLEGAQKHKAKEWAKRLEDVADDDLANHPLSKSWPEPDYQAMIDEGADPAVAAFIRATREAIKAKPRQPYKVRRWAGEVRLLREMSRGVASGDISMSEVRAKLTDTGISGKVALYERFGHEKSLKDLSLKEHSYSMRNGQRYSPALKVWEVTRPYGKSAFSNMPHTLAEGATMQEALDAFAPIYEGIKVGAKGGAKRETKFIIWRDRKDNLIHVGKKTGSEYTSLATFEDVAEARKYRDENHDELVEKLSKAKETPFERRRDNRDRVGEDRRNGRDVQPETFQKAFGFRGVQFGNYVEGPRRQADLNRAYDSLLDLSDVIDIPSEAVSLNGTLGLAFGARGRGGKNAEAAHFEADSIVINLTKNSGAGSLAHEWWHGLDNYFSRMRGDNVDFLSERYSAKRDGVRPEMVEAFKAVRDAISDTGLPKRSGELDTRRSAPYWQSGREMTARAFEQYIISKVEAAGGSNDFLANIVDLDFWNAQEALLDHQGDTYPYLKDNEQAAVFKAFDRLFDTMQSERTDAGTVRLYQRQGDTFAAEFMSEMASVDELFRYPRSDRAEIGKTFAEVAPDVSYVGEIGPDEITADAKEQERHLFRTGNGTDFYVHRTDDEVWFDVSRLKEGDGGSGLYAAVADYAHNTGRKFIGDPDGLSDVALRRRNEAMLSSAMKYGTTEHLEPHEYQLQGNPDIGVPPLDWTGDDLDKIQSMIEVSVASTEALVPELQDARYDFASRTFRTGEGQPIADELFESWAIPARRVGEASIGRNTLKRSILLRSLLRATGGERPGLLERVLRQSAQLVEGGLEGTFYQQAVAASDQVQADPAKIKALIPALQQRLKDLMIRGVNVEFDPEMLEQGATEIDRNNAIKVLIGNTLNGVNTLNHEVIHILRAMNLFAQKEWAALAAEAEKVWMARYDVAGRYSDLSRDGQIEEAVAQAFADYIDGKKPATTALGNAFAKVKRFFRAMKETLLGQGITRVEDIFDKVDEGKVGSRPQGDAEAGARRMFQRQPAIDMPLSDPAQADQSISDDLLSGTSEMVVYADSWRGGTKEQWDNFLVQVQDRMLPIKRMEETVAKATGRAINKATSPYYAEERYYSQVGVRLEDLKREFIEPVIMKIAKQNRLKNPITLTDMGGETRTGSDAVGLWLWARHAQERNRHIATINRNMPDGGSGMTNAQAQAILNEAANGRHAALLDEIGQQVDTLTRKNIDLRESAGLLSARDAMAWRTMYQHYVPLKGFADPDSDIDFVGTGRGMNVKGPESKRALGRSSEAINPLAGLITQAQEVAIRVEKNNVGKTLVRFMQENPAPDLYELSKVEQVRYFNKATGMVETRAVHPLTRMQEANEFAVKVDGKEYRVKFKDQRMADAMSNIGVSNLNAVMRAVGKHSRYFSMINTTLNPSFMPVNAFRDIGAAMINLSSFAKGDANRIRAGVLKNWGKAMRGAYRGENGKFDTKWSKYYREYAEAGGKVSFWVMEQPEVQLANLKKREWMESTLAGRASKMVRFDTDVNPWLNFIENANLAVDNAVRLAAYVSAREAGWSKADAASLGKNLTVNFNRRGKQSSWMNALFPFTNAAIQGTDILVKAVKQRPVAMGAIIAGIIAEGILMDALNAGLSEEDDDGELIYDKVPAYVQSRNIIIPGFGDENFITVPVAYGYNVFHNLGVQIGKLSRGVKEPGEVSSQVLAEAVASMTPFDGRDIQDVITPEILKPVAAYVQNKDWQGRKIWPEYEFNDYGPRAYKSYQGTSEFWKALSDTANRATGGSTTKSGAIDVSPEYLEYLWGWLSGGSGRFVNNVIDTATAVATGDEVQARKIPIIRRLNYSTSVYNDSQRFWDFGDFVSEAHAMQKTSEETGDPISEDQRKVLHLYKTFNAAKKERKKIQNQITAVYEDDTLTPRQRTDKLKPLRERERKIYLDFNRKFIDRLGPQGE